MLRSIRLISAFLFPHVPTINTDAASGNALFLLSPSNIPIGRSHCTVFYLKRTLYVSLKYADHAKLPYASYLWRSIFILGLYTDWSLGFVIYMIYYILSLPAKLSILHCDPLYIIVVSIFPQILVALSQLPFLCLFVGHSNVFPYTRKQLF